MNKCGVFRFDNVRNALDQCRTQQEIVVGESNGTICRYLWLLEVPQSQTEPIEFGPQIRVKWIAYCARPISLTASTFGDLNSQKMILKLDLLLLSNHRYSRSLPPLLVFHCRQVVPSTVQFRLDRALLLTHNLLFTY